MIPNKIFVRSSASKYLLIAGALILVICFCIITYNTQRRKKLQIFHQDLSKYKLEVLLNPINTRVKRVPSLRKYYTYICNSDKEKTELIKNIDFKAQNAEYVHEMFNNFVMNPHNGRCANIQRIGGQYLPGCHYWDGHKFLCTDELHKDIENNECLVYSFGIANDWSFEKILGSIGCKVFAFDPTTNHPKELETNVLFEQIGISATTDVGNSLDTLSSILRKHGHAQSKISYLKIDIEGHEVDGLLQWFESGALRTVQQIGLEYHLHDTDATLRFFHALIKLYFEEGFRLISFDINGCAGKQHQDYPHYAEIVLMKQSNSSICIEKTTVK